MNPRRDTAGEAAHRATQEWLPWLLNGRLGGAELDAAQAHLDLCGACRADLAGLRRLREAPPPEPPCDPDAALARLLARLDPPAGACAGRLAAPAAPLHSAPAGPAPAMARPAANDSRWLRRAALVQCGVIVVLAALLAWPRAPVDNFRALGAAPAVRGQAVVVFRPETTERELRRIVDASGARIVDGPTVTDAWVLAIPGSDPAPSLARLRAEPAVLLAEPLDGEGRP